MRPALLAGLGAGLFLGIVPGALLLRAEDVLFTNAGFVTERTITSPNGSFAFALERNEATRALVWSAQFNGRPLVNRGALGIEIEGWGVVGDQGPLVHAEQRDINRTWRPPYGERAEIPDRCREEILTLHQPGQHGPEVRLQVRAYDEGVAFRYLVSGEGNWTVVSETTSFPLPGNTMVWTSASAQGKITRQAVSAIRGAVERPLTAELAPDLFAVFGEAALVNQARMKFVLQGKSAMQASLDGLSSFTNDFASPWRYVRAAKSPGALLEGNHFVLNLNEPNQIGDTSWLRPGKVLREMTLTTLGALACIDYAAAHQLQFIMFDAGWYGHEYDDKADASAVNVDPKRSPGPLDLPKVIATAKSKNIGVILYVNRRALEKQLDQLLPLYQKWGVAGIKFGFVQTGSQHWTAWLHDAIAKCAKYNLMVDVHDDYRMTGVERALPNFMTAEGVRGDEESPPNEEVLNSLFTRCLAGAADQTGCYFAPRVNTMGSHASQLAKMICVYSPWQSVFWYDRPAGSPGGGGAGNSKASVLQEVPEMTFFERLPTVWDETRVLDGYPGTHAVITRRSGEVWFIGTINGPEAREFRIPLDFLPDGRNFQMELFSDEPAAKTPTQVLIQRSVVDRKTVIQRPVGMRNGLAAILTPVE